MSRNLLISAVVVILIIGVVGVLLVKNSKSTQQIVTPHPTVAQVSPTPTPQVMTVMLKEENKSGESGTATLTEQNGQVMVSLDMMGEPTTASQPAHIHVGVCPGVGAVKYPLSNVVGGKSDTTLPAGVTLDSLMSHLPLAINVHKSAAAMGVYVACGELGASASAAISITPTAMMHVTPTSAMMIHSTAAPSVPSPTSATGQ